MLNQILFRLKLSTPYFTRPARKIALFVINHKKLSFTFLGSGIGIALLPVFIVGGFSVVEAVDSSEFCLDVCHDVHYPEAVTYHVSPHNEVTCASCHVGEGTKNLINSKLENLPDLIPTITGNYHKPILTPLKNQRPATDTCETCHWSDRYYGDNLKIESHYAADENNTQSKLALVLKLGGGQTEVSEGIHWHATANIWYLATDKQRQQIAWLAVEDENGNVTEYMDPDRIAGISPEQIQTEKRYMDCVDCHNRVAHVFESPETLIDAALDEGSIDSGLPYIKRYGMDALVPQNASIDEAYLKIDNIKNIYLQEYPDVIIGMPEELDQALVKLKEIADITTFSDGLDWNTHPDNSVHDAPDANMQVDWTAIAQDDESAGCFRCHGNLVEVESTKGTELNQALDGLNLDLLVQEGNTLEPQLSGLYQSQENTLDSDCNSCHYTREAGDITPLAPATPHPIDGLDACLTCHAPGAPEAFSAEHPWASNDACTTCHQSSQKVADFPVGTIEKAATIPHDTDGLEDCLSCHGEGGIGAFSQDHVWSTNDTCLTCHEPSGAAASAIPQATIPVAAAIPHAVTNFENCLTCHGQGGITGYSLDHFWTNNDVCMTCHEPGTAPSIPQASIPVGKLIPHSVQGVEGSCLTCHASSATRTNHTWTTASSCLICHSTGQGALISPSSLVQGASIPHSISGLSDCTSCHTTSGPAPFPVSHAGRTNNLCLSCHQPSGTTTPVATSPSAPGNLLAVVAGDQVNLSWSDTSTNEGGFTIQRSTNESFSSVLVTLDTLSSGTTSFTDSTVSGSTTYYYRVTAFNSAGASAPSNTATATTPVSTVQKPAAPGNLSATAGTSQVNLSWTDNANNEAGYRIERAATGTFTSNVIAVNRPSGSTTFSDTAITGGTTYYYRVIAFNAGGESAPSNVASITTSASVPSQDMALVFSNNCDSCHGINREGGIGPALTPSALATKTLDYITSKVNHMNVLTAAEIPLMAEFLKGSVPATPSNLSAAAAGGNVNLTWSDNSADETGFRIERASNASFTTGLITLNSTTAGATAYTDTTVSGSTTYYYRIIAFNSAGDSTPSNAASVTTPASTVQKPAAPGSLTATVVSTSQVNLSWTDNANNETGYRVERATNSSFTSNLVSVNRPAGAASYSDTTVTSSTTYYYRVIAFNAGGDSTPSNTASVTTPSPSINISQVYSTNCASCHGINREGGAGPALTSTALASRTLDYVLSRVNHRSVLSSTEIPLMAAFLKGTVPSAPSGLSAAAAGGNVNLTWSDNSADETGFRIERASNAAFSTGLVTVDVTLAGVTTYTDATVSGSTTYYYRIIATNAAGDSAPSNAASVTTSASSVPKPAAPGNLSATATGSTQVDLTWTDNANNETGYRVERATNSSFTSNLVAVNNPAGTTSYSDTTVTGGTTYYYRILAFNAGGDSSPSNTATVTTAAAPPPVVATTVPHTTTSGYESCLSCHSDNLNIRPFPSSHIGRTESSCLTCHDISGSSTIPFLSVRQRIPHSITGSRENCLSCHDRNRSEPFPRSHIGYENITCLVCHRTSY